MPPPPNRTIGWVPHRLLKMVRSVGPESSNWQPEGAHNPR